jgi:diaminopimelate decarboxylase
VSPRITVRVNPDFELRSSGMKMSGGSKPFGIDAELVPALLRRIAGLPLDFHGFQIFCGSQSLDGRAIADAQQASLALALDLAAYAPRAPRVINIGGGLGIPYFPGEQPLDPGPIAATLSVLARRLTSALPEARLVIELGRYIVGEAGFYVCSVIDRKVSRGQVFLVVDGGLHHHLAATGNLGQVLRRNYPALIGNQIRADLRETVSVVGPLCTPLDVLAESMELARAEPGDLFVILQSGAYGLTASPTGFLSHPAPAELLL